MKTLKLIGDVTVYRFHNIIRGLKGNESELMGDKDWYELEEEELIENNVIEIPFMELKRIEVDGKEIDIDDVDVDFTKNYLRDKQHIREPFFWSELESRCDEEWIFEINDDGKFDPSQLVLKVFTSEIQEVEDLIIPFEIRYKGKELNYDEDEHLYDWNGDTPRLRKFDFL